MKTGIAVGVCAALALGAGSASAGVEGVALGSVSAPPTVGGFVLTPFALDMRPQFVQVPDVMAPGDGVVSFWPQPATHRRAGTTWFRWGHGYTGDVYYAEGVFNGTLSLPPNTKAFVVYVNSNFFTPVPGTVRCSDGSSTATIQTSIPADFAGGYAFYATGDSTLSAVQISSPLCDFGVGEFSIAIANPCPADLNGDGLVDFADYLEFLNLYDAGDLAVDFNDDGLVDFSDYLEFLNLYDAGC